MSTEPRVDTYNDAEKGTVEVATITVPPTSYPGDEKKVDNSIALPEVKKENATPPAKKSPPKPKKKVSKWIRWTLWFNTYR